MLLRRKAKAATASNVSFCNGERIGNIKALSLCAARLLCRDMKEHKVCQMWEERYLGEGKDKNFSGGA